MKNARFLIIILILISLLVLCSCSAFLKWQIEAPDNFFEEIIEDTIKENTGRDLDLTPITGKEKQEFNTLK